MHDLQVPWGVFLVHSYTVKAMVLGVLIGALVAIAITRSIT